MKQMTLGDCKKAIFRLLNQYSIAGNIVPLTYNDQEDDYNRMIDLINSAMMDVATTNKPISAYITYEVEAKDPKDPIREIELEMPDDFITATGVFFTPSNSFNEMTIDASHYKWLGDDTLLIPNTKAGMYRIEYNRYPVRYDDSTPDNTVLDNTPEVHEAIPYYCAAMISLDQNPKAYYALYNIWETKLSRIGYKQPHAVVTDIEDVYGLSNFHGVW